MCYAHSPALVTAELTLVRLVRAHFVCVSLQAFAVDVLASARAALNDDDAALQAITAACEPPLDAAQLALLLPEATRTESDDNGAAAVAALLSAKSVTL
jgi:hypothetical protein